MPILSLLWIFVVLSRTHYFFDFMDIQLRNETDPLRSVIVGLAQDRPAMPHGNNPKIQENIAKGTIPDESELVEEVEGFVKTLTDAGVQVLRPEVLPNQDQIFTRDISFVIDKTLVRAGMRKPNRRVEFDAIRKWMEDIEHIIEPPEGVFIEGGDVILCDDTVFVGVGGRTNEAGVAFLQEQFPQKKIVSLPMVVSDDPYTNILHLDCTFQPVGKDMAIIYEAGFIRTPDAVFERFPENKCIKVSQQEMYDMAPNVFSITPGLVVIDKRFTRLRDELEARGIRTLPVAYEKVSRFGGLLRCSTLPLYRNF